MLMLTFRKWTMLYYLEIAHDRCFRVEDFYYHRKEKPILFGGVLAVKVLYQEKILDSIRVTKQSRLCVLFHVSGLLPVFLVNPKEHSICQIPHLPFCLCREKKIEL